MISIICLYITPVIPFIHIKLDMLFHVMAPHYSFLLSSNLKWLFRVYESFLEYLRSESLSSILYSRDTKNVSPLQCCSSKGPAHITFSVGYPIWSLLYIALHFMFFFHSICLIHYCSVVKRHHNHGNSYKRKNLMWPVLVRVSIPAQTS